MTRVYKGAGPKGGTYLACALAKTGGGCKYRAVRYEPVEEAFLREAGRVLSEVPADNGKQGDTFESALLHLEEQRAKLLANLKRTGPSPKLTAQLRRIDHELATVRQEQDEFLIEQADSAGPVVARKIANLRTVLRAKQLDRAEANALLRQLFTGVVVEYAHSTQFLRLTWKQGGESTVVYGMEPAAKRRRA